MKTILLKVNNTNYNEVLNILKQIPEDKLNIITESENTDIPFVDDEEQKEIEQLYGSKPKENIDVEETIEVNI